MITMIVEAAGRSFLLGALVWLALALVRPRNPHLQKTVWISVLLASIAMPLLITSQIAPAFPAPTYMVSLKSGASAIATPPATWAISATTLYVLVVLALLARFAVALFRTWRISRTATRLHESWTQNDDVRVSLRLRAPATFGSIVLLPPECLEWSEQKLAAVMSHERSHVQRKDCYVLWIARLYTCVFWINPLAWWMQSRLAALAETTSDDAAVAELGDRPAYAEVLLEIAATPGAGVTAAAAQMATARHPVTVRIERIISDIAPAVLPKRRHQALAIALLLPIVAVSSLKLAWGQETDPLAPKMLFTQAPDLETFYPKEAKRLGVDGWVTISISLDAQGRPTNTLILDEYPPDVGFGAAASALVHTYEYSNPSHKPAELSIKVKFELKNGGQGPADAPPPPNPAGG
jgi:bla regulator protein blaR1